MSDTNTSWVLEQSKKNISQFEQSMEDSHPETISFLYNSEDYFARVCEQCNYLDATQKVNWTKYIKEGATVLDLGCGGGWLSGLLSKYDAVSLIYAVDSSRYFLNDIMPGVLDIMGAKCEKIVPVEGLFSPLLIEDNSLDVVVASSVLHHAENLEQLLVEIKRVLKKGGYLVILNETPPSAFRYLASISKAFIRIFSNMLLRRYQSLSPSISSSGYIYDPQLGDRDYPVWYWLASIKKAGFEIEDIDKTSLATVKGEKGRKLTHFICKSE